ncbi:hypothetical protein AABB24_035729 [Solanum stoloniferum]|uniref:DOMON domain-containing protein n=1 Tax=Solanum stoloniferum TaxID=62892 RepID=A0ABD2R8U5_9SOLN
MKVFALWLLVVVVQEVNSQDSCTSNLNLKNKPLFDISSFHCVSVWDEQGYILRYLQTDREVWSFVISAPNSNSFIGMGFSKDGKMVGSSAIVGWVSNDGSSTMKRYFLGGESSAEVVPDQGNLQLVNMTSSIIAQNSTIYMAFQLNTQLTPTNRLIYSLGPMGRLPSPVNYQLSQHRAHISTFLDYNSGHCIFGSTRKGIKSKKILELVSLHTGKGFDNIGSSKYFLRNPFRRCRHCLECWFCCYPRCILQHFYRSRNKVVDDKINYYSSYFSNKLNLYIFNQTSVSNSS